MHAANNDEIKQSTFLAVAGAVPAPKQLTLPLCARMEYKRKLALYCITHGFIYPGLDGITKDLQERVNAFWR
jgi:hypothetical protein